jgi:Ala-tRNA(Pro) deacylase
MNTDTDIGTTDTKNKERVYALLDELGIAYEVADHPAIFSARDNAMHDIDIGAVIFKNLFLRNKGKNRYYLYSLPIDKRADLKALRHLLGEAGLSFGSSEALWEKLHITPGTVSLLNVIDAPGTDVIIAIDNDIYKTERFGVHPNDNTATVILTPDALPKIFEWARVEYRFVDLLGS